VIGVHNNRLQQTGALGPAFGLPSRPGS